MKRRKTTAKSTPRTKGGKARGPEERLALGHLDRHLGYFVRRLQIWVFQDFMKTLRPLKLRTAQYSVLLLIEANPATRRWPASFRHGCAPKPSISTRRAGPSTIWGPG